jgi:hypothetical protein
MSVVETCGKVLVQRPGGVARFNYVLVTNSNPVMTCASDGRVNPYPNKSYSSVVFSVYVSIGPIERVETDDSTTTVLCCSAAYVIVL